MGKKIIRILTIILLIMISALVYKVYIKSKIKEENTVFNKSNEVYIKISYSSQIKSAFTGDKFSLINREKL